ncbi:MAG TPA: hypothetical protein VHP14_25620 [Anaerolineales bacterium]|nr:hypothetical protein [Anaerolineales bacterium]
MERYTPQAYEQFVRDCLSRQDQRVSHILAEICRQQPSFPAAQLHIEVAPRGILNGLPITIFYSDERGRLLPGSVVSLEEAFGNILTPVETEAVYCFDEIGVETIEIELQILLEWFTACWQTMQKTNLLLPAYLSIQNDREALDLFHMRWISNPLRNIRP